MNLRNKFYVAGLRGMFGGAGINTLLEAEPEIVLATVAQVGGAYITTRIESTSVSNDIQLAYLSRFEKLMYFVYSCIYSVITSSHDLRRTSYCLGVLEPTSNDSSFKVG